MIGAGLSQVVVKWWITIIADAIDVWVEKRNDGFETVIVRQGLELLNPWASLIHSCQRKLSDTPSLMVE